MIMVGYAKNQHPTTRKIRETRNIVWMGWKRQNRDTKLFDQISDELNQPAGVDEMDFIIMDEQDSKEAAADG